MGDFGAVATTKEYAEKNTMLEMGGPEALSQLDAVRMFENALLTKIKVDFVSEQDLRAQHQSSDPLQKTFGALMLAYAQGDAISGAVSVAKAHGVTLRAVSEYAGGFGAQPRA